MNLNDIKDLMTQFDQSSLREFSYKNGTDELQFSKNEARPVPEVATQVAPAPVLATPSPVAPTSAPAETVAEEVPAPAEASVATEGNLVESPLVGVVYLAAGPDKPAFVTVGDSVKKGQTLVIIEAMKVMNEIPAPKDGVVTEILVSNEEMVELVKDWYVSNDRYSRNQRSPSPPLSYASSGPCLGSEREYHCCYQKCDHQRAFL